MVYLIPKDKIPQQQYTPAKYKEEIVMITTVPRGVVMMFLDINENVFMPWDEVIEYAAVAPRDKVPEEAEEAPLQKTEKKPGVREVIPSKPK